MREIKTSFVLDGEKKFRENLQAIQREIKINAATLSTLTAEYNKDSKSLTATADKYKLLKEQVQNNQNQVKMYSDAVEGSEKRLKQANFELDIARLLHGENSKEVTKAENAVNRAQKSYDNYRLKLQQSRDALNQSEHALETYEKSLEKTVKSSVDFEKIKERVKNVASALKSGAENVGKFATEIGKVSFKVFETGVKAVADVTAEIIKATKKIVEFSIDSGSAFEQSMANVMATMSIQKDTVQDGANLYDMLKSKAEEMGATTKFTAAEAADALNFLALAGYDAQKSTTALPSVVRIAQAGGMDLAKASDIITDSMSAIQMEATNENLEHFADVLAKTAQSSNTTVEQLGEALIKTGGQAKLANLSLEEMATMLGILANNGIKAEEGGVALRNLIRQMYTPTDKAAEAFEELGVSTRYENGELRNIQDVLLDTLRSLDSFGDAGKKLDFMTEIFSARTVNTAAIGIQNSAEEYDKLIAKINDADGAAKQMAETMTDTFKGDVTALGSAMQSFGNKIYESFQDPLRSATQELTTYVRTFATAFEEGGISKAFVSIKNAIDENILDIVSYVPRAVNEVILPIADGVKDIFVSLILKLPDAIPDIVDAGADLFSGILTGFSTVTRALYRRLPEIAESLQKSLKKNVPQVAKASKSLFTALVTGLNTALDVIIPLLPKVIITISQAIESNIDGIINAGIDIILKLAEGIDRALPTILRKATTLITRLSESFFTTENVDRILQTAIKLITTLANGLSNSESKLFKAAIDIISNIIKAITKNLSRLLEAGAKIITAIANALISNIDSLADGVAEIVVWIVEWLAEDNHLVELVKGAITIVLAVAKGILDNLAELSKAVGDMITEIVNQLAKKENIEKIVKQGKEILKALVRGLLDFGVIIYDFSQKLFNEIDFRIRNTDWSVLGQNILNGIFAGVTGYEGFDVKEWFGNFGEYWRLGAGATEQEVSYLTPEQQAEANRYNELNSKLGEVYARFEEGIASANRILHRDTVISPNTAINIVMNNTITKEADADEVMDRMNRKISQDWAGIGYNGVGVVIR